MLRIGDSAQADALELEAMAKRRLADEYDAAQERGEVRTKGGDYTSKVKDENLAPTLDDIGLSKEQIFEARQIRDAEAEDPGIVRRTLDALLEVGEEPTKAAVKRARRCNLAGFLAARYFRNILRKSVRPLSSSVA